MAPFSRSLHACDRLAMCVPYRWPPAPWLPVRSREPLSTAYAAWEARAYTLRRVELPLLPPGHEPLTVLHLTDIHMTPDQRRKQEWLRGLADLEPDLVVNTGDNLGHRDSVPVVTEALGPLLDRPGVFVFGSNDYYEPSLRNPLLYLLPDTGKRNINRPKLPWPDLQRAYVEAGWLDLTNRHDTLKVGGTSFAFAGVDDPHLRYDRLDLVAGPADAAADVRLGVTHAPYLRVLDQFAADGYDAVIAGHTHGGQVCLPVPRRADHQLRPRQRPRQGPAPAPGGLPRRRPREHLAARLRRRRHQSLRPDPGRLPARGNPADADPRPPDRLNRFRDGRRRSGMVAQVADRPARPAGPHRAVAQLGSAPRSGRGGRRFKSCQPDQCDVSGHRRQPDLRIRRSGLGLFGVGPGGRPVGW